MFSDLSIRDDDYSVEEEEEEEEEEERLSELFFKDLKIISLIAIPIVAKALGTIIVRKGNQTC